MNTHHCLQVIVRDDCWSRYNESIKFTVIGQCIFHSLIRLYDINDDSFLWWASSVQLIYNMKFIVHVVKRG